MEYRPGPHRRHLATALLALALLSALSSCSSRLGWGLVLWSASEGKLPAGSVVPVYIKSNINHVYVVGSLDGKSKVELPLWQVEVFGSRRKARDAAAKFSSVASLYLVATRDGLPVRAEPVIKDDNKVYRLREGQSVKVLSVAKGEVVRTGDTPLAGDWYYVLADDGTRGYVFSNTMRLFDEKKDAGAAPTTAGSSMSAVKIDVFFTRQWRPLYFQEMKDSGRPDLDVFNPRYGIFIDAIRRQIRLELPAASQVFTYNSITEEAGSFLFEGSPLRVKFIDERRLVADWTGDSLSQAPAQDGAAGKSAPQGTAAATGTAKPGAPADATQAAPSSNNGPGTQATPPAAPFASSFGSTGRAEFVVLAFDIRDVIRTEELRRQRLLDAFLGKGSDWSLLVLPSAASGPGTTAPGAPSSGTPAPGAPDTAAPALPESLPAEVAKPSASRLQVTGDGRFRWIKPELVPPGYLPISFSASPDGATGDIAFRLYLPQALEPSWSGSLSLRFDAQAGSDWMDFLWRIDGDGLVLQPVDAGSNQDVGNPSPLQPLRFAKARQ